MKSKNQSIFITGGAGFIGGHVCAHFLENGYRVVCIDDLSSGKESTIKRLAKIKEVEFKFFEGNIRDRVLVNKAIQEALQKDCVACIHLAAKASVPLLNEQPALAISDNIIGFDIIISECHKANIPRFIYASSSAVYGDQNTMPIAENFELKPTNIYGWSKLSNEVSAASYPHGQNFWNVGMRFFNVFGPNQDPNGPYAAVIPRWIDAAFEGNDLTIFGDGTQSRDFIGVQHISNFIDKLINMNETPRHRIYNVGHGKATDLNTLASIFQQLGSTKGHRINIIRTSERIGDIKHSVADTSRMQSVIAINENENFSLQ